MPSRNDIYNEIKNYKRLGQDIVRKKYLGKLHNYTKRDTILYSSGFITPKSNRYSPSAYGINDSDISAFMSALYKLKSDNLDIIMHSPGGSAEAAEQIIKYLREKYNHIRLIIPMKAMSAATMIACACDIVVMCRHSAIGPIDPQLIGPNFSAPAQSILDEFEKAKVETAKNPKNALLWVKRIEKYPPGFLTTCDNIIRLSKVRVEEWLRTWMFKNDSMRKKKAKRIADWLGTASNHKTHNRPISYNEAKSQGLKVELLEDEQKLQELVLSLFHSSMATHDFTFCTKFVENHLGKGHYTTIQPKQ